jgi:hypothetical protein
VIGGAPLPGELWQVLTAAAAVQRDGEGDMHFTKVALENRASILQVAAWTGHPEFPETLRASRLPASQIDFVLSAVSAYQKRRADSASLDLVETGFKWTDNEQYHQILFRTLVAQGAEVVLAGLERDAIRRNADLGLLVRDSDEPSDEPAAYPFGSVDAYQAFWVRAIDGVLGRKTSLSILFRARSNSEWSVDPGIARGIHDRYQAIEPVVLEKLVARLESLPIDSESRYQARPLFTYWYRSGKGPEQVLQRIEAEFVRTMRSTPVAGFQLAELIEHWPDSKPVPDALAGAVLDRLSESGGLIQFCLQHGVRIEPDVLRRELFDEGIGEFDYDDLIDAIGPQRGVDNREVARVLADLGMMLLDRGGMSARNGMPSLCRKLAVFLDPVAVPVLLRALGFDYEPTRTAARAALETIRFHAEQKAHWNRLLAGEPDLGESKVAARLVAQAAADQPRAQRLLAIRSLGALGEPAALTFLVDWSSDSDAEVAEAAKVAAERILTGGR